MPSSVTVRPLAPVRSATYDDRESAGVGTGQELFAVASARLRRAVPFDAAGWFAVDPATLLPTSPVLIENIVAGYCADYWQREHTVEDVLLFRDLARAPHPTATLFAATDGNPRRSARFREYMAPHGYGDELRTVMRIGDRAWGVAVLLRRSGRAPFSAREVERVSGAVPAIAAGLAALVVAERPDAGTDGADCPGVAVFGPCGALSSIDGEARRWFRELAGDDWTGSDVFRTVLSSLTARADAVAGGRDRGPVTARLRTPGGRWLALQASRQTTLDTGTDTTVVVVGPATSRQVAPIIVDAYRLTPREQQVTQAVARGLANADIARELYLSPHTVRDHLKAVFGKLDVATRGELVAKLFADRSLPVLEAPGTHIDW